MGSRDFIEFTAAPDEPKSPYELLGTDLPLLSLRITSFTDATLVALVWPHTLMDALGMEALLQAWSLVVSGRESEVPPLVGARDDVTIAAIKSTPEEDQAEKKEEWTLASKRLKGLGLVTWILRSLWSIIWDGPCQERTVFLSREAVSTLRARAISEAQEASPSNGTRPFLSEGDVIAAWVARIVALSEPKKKPVTLLCTLNLRYWLEFFKKTTAVYPQNLALATCTILSPTVARASVGEIAAANRQSLVQQTTQTQLRKSVRIFIEGNEKGGAPMLFGESNMLLVCVTNWTKAKVMTAADFGSAVIQPGDTGKSRTNRPGTTNYLLASSKKSSIMTRHLVRVVGKDHEGNYWLSGVLLPRAWAKLEEELEIL